MSPPLSLCTCQLVDLFPIVYVAEPEQWGGQCDTGHRQSPIDLAYGASVQGSFEDFQFHDYQQPILDAKVTNNGHSGEFGCHRWTKREKRNANSISNSFHFSPFFLPSSLPPTITTLYLLFAVQINVGAPDNVVMEGGGLPHKYVLDQMHFHWGSEHTINGRRYPLELHMVHHDVRFATLSDALASKNGVAVLGILFHVSTLANENLENILKAVEEVVDTTEKSANIPKLMRADSLLPSNTSTFFRYEGSLTTPGCSESVIWTVFTKTVSISFDQAELFKHVKDSHGAELTHNFRSLQPLNSRALVYAAPMDDLVGQPGAGIMHKPSVFGLLVVLFVSLVKWLH